MLEFLTCGKGGRLDCSSKQKQGRRGSSAFAYIDFTSRDEWPSGEHAKVRDEKR